MTRRQASIVLVAGVLLPNCQLYASEDGPDNETVISDAFASDIRCVMVPIGLVSLKPQSNRKVYDFVQAFIKAGSSQGKSARYDAYLMDVPDVAGSPGDFGADAGNQSTFMIGSSPTWRT